jgi:hypothetical protein
MSEGLQVGRGYGLPAWITGHIAVCSVCKKKTLIFELRDAKGTYYHCMICNGEFEAVEHLQ